MMGGFYMAYLESMYFFFVCLLVDNISPSCSAECGCGRGRLHFVLVPAKEIITIYIMIHAIHTPQKIRLVLPPVYPWIDILSKASWRGKHLH
jgi:hypothetical protein